MPASALVRRVLFGLLAANLVVVGAKLAVAIASKSLAVFGSALDSSVDALNNVLALIVVRVAAKAPTRTTPTATASSKRSAPSPSSASCRSPASSWCVGPSTTSRAGPGASA